MQGEQCNGRDKEVGFLFFPWKNGSFPDGRSPIIVPLSFFLEIKNLSLKQRSEWMILDDQYFTFADLSKVYSVCELLKQTY